MSQTTSIATAKIENGSFHNRSLISRNGLTGTMARVLVVTLLLAVVTGLLLLLRQQGLAFVELSYSLLGSTSLIIWISMVKGVVFSEYPRGDEAAMLRVGLATFCRTGFPLLVVLLVLNYATRLDSVAIYVGILYAVGLASSLVLEVSRLGSPFTGRQSG